jgi:hypothetical protein
MNCRRGLRMGWLAVLALGVGFGPAVALPAAPAAAAATLVEQITALHSEGLDWRAELAPRLVEVRGARAVTGPVQGDVVAGTVTLPDRLVLTGDTTIVARWVALTGAYADRPGQWPRAARLPGPRGQLGQPKRHGWAGGAGERADPDHR